MFELNPTLRRRFAGPDAFDQILALEGTVYRQLEGRTTLSFTCEGKRYFAKIHRGVGWKELTKNLCSLRLPVLGANSERRAIRRVQALGLDTMTIAGFGCRGWNPVRRQSFLITEALDETLSLEEFVRQGHFSKLPFSQRRSLIEQLATIARTLHEQGVNHRDFYLCHFLIRRSESGVQSAAAVRPPRRVFLIDLHRAQVRRRTPRRWIVKDLAGLFFSSMDAGLTRADVMRFVRHYRRGWPARLILGTEWRLWNNVRRQAFRLYRKTFSVSPPINQGRRHEDRHRSGSFRSALGRRGAMDVSTDRVPVAGRS